MLLFSSHLAMLAIIVHVIFLDDIEVNEDITSPSSDDTSGNMGSVVI
jgi:hypothetical protein